MGVSPNKFSRILGLIFSESLFMKSQIHSIPLNAHFRAFGNFLSCAELQKVVNPVVLDDRKYIQNEGLAENISKTYKKHMVLPL